ncbi:uncharacterized protein LOC141686441 [Apium graveolens]|uniref:uncharacterized protein LOC141686441 n=1 Tax=Apium graveolens TaxID=4045 RepID=UPI003D796BC5
MAPIRKYKCGGEKRKEKRRREAFQKTQVGSLNKYFPKTTVENVVVDEMDIRHSINSDVNNATVVENQFVNDENENENVNENENQNSNGLGLYNELVEVLNVHELDIDNIRGQGYDNGSNMKGKNKVNHVSEILQSENIQIDVAIRELKGLLSFLQNYREVGFQEAMVPDLNGDDLYEDLCMLRRNLPEGIKSAIDVLTYIKEMEGGVVTYLRDAPPEHYSVKIESFTKFVSSGVEKYESAKFDASGYTWKLVLYPNGNGRRGGRGHISLYLAIQKTDSLCLCWEAYVTYKMFVFDHNKDKYLTIQDDPVVQQIRRFHQAKKESGFDRLIPLETFNAATNGYLVDDSCVFGVEVYKVKCTGNGETVKVLEHPREVTFDWKICEFSKICKEKLNCQGINSEEFTDGECKWRLLLYPNGDSSTKDHLSLYLELVESPTMGKKVLTEFSFLIKDQLSESHHQHTVQEWWFSTSAEELITANVVGGWGFAKFMLLSDLKNELSGFIVNDTMLLQAKVEIKAEVTSFS